MRWSIVQFITVSKWVVPGEVISQSRKIALSDSDQTKCEISRNNTYSSISLHFRTSAAAGNEEDLCKIEKWFHDTLFEEVLQSAREAYKTSTKFSPFINCWLDDNAEKSVNALDLFNKFSELSKKADLDTDAVLHEKKHPVIQRVRKWVEQF